MLNQTSGQYLSAKRNRSFNEQKVRGLTNLRSILYKVNIIGVIFRLFR